MVFSTPLPSSRISPLSAGCHPPAATAGRQPSPPCRRCLPESDGSSGFFGTKKAGKMQQNHQNMWRNGWFFWDFDADICWCWFQWILMIFSWVSVGFYMATPKQTVDGLHLLAYIMYFSRIANVNPKKFFAVFFLHSNNNLLWPPETEEQKRKRKKNNENHSRKLGLTTTSCQKLGLAKLWI